MNKYPQEVRDFIAENVKGIPSAELTDLVNKTFGTAYDVRHIRYYMKNHKLRNGIDTSFKKGDAPHNKGVKGVYHAGCEKTWFKKGQPSITSRPVGSERICPKDGYILVKVAEPSVWHHKHRVVWEEHNGPIPASHVIIFLDGDKLNTDISNLEMISRSELSIMNQQKLKSDNPALTETGVLIARLMGIKYRHNRKNNDKNKKKNTID